MNKKSPSLINLQSSYAVKNSFQFIDNTKDLIISNNLKLVSFDVKSFFTLIPLKELNTVLTILINNTIFDESLNIKLKNAIKVCIGQNYVQFNNKIYQQKDGPPIGSPIYPSVSDIFMANLEQLIFNSDNPIIKHVF